MNEKIFCIVNKVNILVGACVMAFQILGAPFFGNISVAFTLSHIYIYGPMFFQHGQGNFFNFNWIENLVSIWFTLPLFSVLISTLAYLSFLWYFYQRFLKKKEFSQSTKRIMKLSIAIIVLHIIWYNLADVVQPPQDHPEENYDYKYPGLVPNGKPLLPQSEPLF